MNTRAGSDGMAGSPRLGLVLCGGGVRGLAHAGVLRALEQAGLRPHVLVGVSMGAIVAATYSRAKAIMSAETGCPRSVPSYAGNWVTGSEKAAYRGG